MNMKLSNYHVVTPPFVDEVDGYTKRVVFATRTGEVRVVDDASWKLAEREELDLLPDDTRLDFGDIELLVPEDEDELATMVGRNSAAVEDDDCLYQVIQPTAYCPLGCGYCGQEHTNKWLSAEHQEQFVRYVRGKLEKKRFQKLSICWFGGEPLSALGVIRSFTPRLKALTEEFDCGYEAKIVTNGLALTDKVATEIVHEHDIQFIEITLDGVAEFHDARRHRKNGKATFDLIFSNTIDVARREDLRNVGLRIRCNVDHRNYEGVSPLLRMLAEEGVQERIAFYVAPIHSWGNDAHTLALSKEDFATWELKWLAEMISLGFEPPLVPARKPITCLAVRPFGDLIDANGNLYNCTEVSYVPMYAKENKFVIGHVSSGETPGKRNLLGDFNERVGRMELPCSSCRMLPVCGGGCPKLWQEGHTPCPSSKYNIEGRLLLSYASHRLSA